MIGANYLHVTPMTNTLSWQYNQAVHSAHFLSQLGGTVT
jgi:hypothetical protein